MSRVMNRATVAALGVAATVGLGASAAALVGASPSAPTGNASATDAAVAIPNSDVRLPSAAAAMLDVASARGVAFADGSGVVMSKGRDAGTVCMMRVSAVDGTGVAAGGCSPARDVARTGLEVAHVPSEGPATVVAYVGDTAASAVGINGVPHVVRDGVVVFSVPRTGGDVTLSDSVSVRRMSFPDWTAQDARARTFRVP